MGDMRYSLVMYPTKERQKMTHETMIQYVVRKLNDPAFNNAEIVRRTGISKATVSEIASGRNADPQTSTVQKLFDAFKALAD